MRNGQITANIEVANSGKLSSSFSLSFCTLMPGGEWVMRCKLFRKRRESSSKLVNSIEQLFTDAVYIVKRVVTRLLFSISIGARWFSSELPRSEVKLSSVNYSIQSRSWPYSNLKYTGSHKAIF